MFSPTHTKEKNPCQYYNFLFYIKYVFSIKILMTFYLINYVFNFLIKIFEEENAYRFTKTI